MNAAYEYNTHEAASIVANRIYYLLESRHWSVKTLSDESNIPYETLKKLLSRKTEHTSFHNIIKIALALNCNIDYLLEPLQQKKMNFLYSDGLPVFSNIYDVSRKNVTIPLYYPAGSSVKDSSKDSSRDSSKKDFLDITSYSHEIRNSVEFGIVISSYYYHPIYHDKDVLLISRKRPPHLGEAGIFLHHGNLYVRILFKNSNSVILKSVNGIGPDIQIFDFSEWIILGYIVGVHKL